MESTTDAIVRYDAVTRVLDLDVVSGDGLRLSHVRDIALCDSGSCVVYDMSLSSIFEGEVSGSLCYVQDSWLNLAFPTLCSFPSIGSLSTWIWSFSVIGDRQPRVAMADQEVLIGCCSNCLTKTWKYAGYAKCN